MSRATLNQYFTPTWAAELLRDGADNHQRLAVLLEDIATETGASNT